MKDPRFIAMSANYYGLGETADEAKKNLRAQGGQLKEYLVKELPDGVKDVFVDDLGSVRWTWADPETALARPSRIELAVVESRGL